MEENNLSRTLILAFIVVMIAYFAVWFYATSQITQEAIKLEEEISDDFKPRVEYITIEGTSKVESTRKVLVHERFVGVIDKDGSVVAISKDGQAHNVVNGVVLADGMVISANDESYSVYRVNDPEKSSSSDYESHVVPFP